MITIIGLGNPGEKFKNTRHNVGFMAIDDFAKKHNFPDFKLQKKFNALISLGRISQPSAYERGPTGEPEKENITLVKPQTFMNESGKSVKKITSNNNIENLIIIHDDIDLPIGKIKIVTERGSAGHKGVESIIENIGNTGLIRFRIGIGSDLSAQAGNKTEAIKVVLKNFPKEEQTLLDEAIKKTVNAIDMFIKEGLEKAMNKFN